MSPREQIWLSSFMLAMGCGEAMHALAAVRAGDDLRASLAGAVAGFALGVGLNILRRRTA